MKIVKGYPPNFKEINKKFKLPKGIVFTYGDILYSPNGILISDDLMVHEEIHSLQQGKNPKRWWDEYLGNLQFRLEQEIEAYRSQYVAYTLKYRDRNQRARFLHKIASDLSGPIYGNVIDYLEAVQLIKGEK